MLHRLREAAATRSFNAPLSGTVEADETFVGGKAKNKHAHKRTGLRGTAGKATVFGMVERGGYVWMMHVADVKAKSVQATTKEHVAPGSAVMTGEAAAFVGLQGRSSPLSVNHSAGECVRHFAIHASTIEGVWSRLKSA